MTKSEAIAVNCTLAYLLGCKRALDVLGVAPKTEIDVEGAAALLGRKAHEALGGGVDELTVRDLWNRRPDARRPS